MTKRSGDSSFVPYKNMHLRSRNAQKPDRASCRYVVEGNVDFAQHRSVSGEFGEGASAAVFCTQTCRRNTILHGYDKDSRRRLGKKSLENAASVRLHAFEQLGEQFRRRNTQVW